MKQPKSRPGSISIEFLISEGALPGADYTCIGKKVEEGPFKEFDMPLCLPREHESESCKLMVFL